MDNNGYTALHVDGWLRKSIYPKRNGVFLVGRDGAKIVDATKYASVTANVRVALIIQEEQLTADKDVCKSRNLGRRNCWAKTIQKFPFNLRLSAFICG